MGHFLEWDSLYHHDSLLEAFKMDQFDWLYFISQWSIFWDSDDF